MINLSEVGLLVKYGQRERGGGGREKEGGLREREGGREGHSHTLTAN